MKSRRPGLDPGPLAFKLNGVQRGGFVYILTNRAHGVLYVGVTAHIDVRIWQHRTGTGSAFCRKYGLDRLVYIEEFGHIEEAIAREKQLKRWRREWKVDLIEAENGHWEDLGYRFQ